ncbi:hypothetical protein Tco_0325870, partial [Tanacetum coccineum]
SVSIFNIFTGLDWNWYWYGIEWFWLPSYVGYICLCIRLVSSGLAWFCIKYCLVSYVCCLNMLLSVVVICCCLSESAAVCLNLISVVCLNLLLPV